MHGTSFLGQKFDTIKKSAGDIDKIIKQTFDDLKQL